MLNFLVFYLFYLNLWYKWLFLCFHFCYLNFQNCWFFNSFESVLEYIFSPIANLYKFQDENVILLSKKVVDLIIDEYKIYWHMNIHYYNNEHPEFFIPLTVYFMIMKLLHINA